MKPPPPDVSRRINRRIVRMLKKGMLTREIAVELGISSRAVEQRIERHTLTPEAEGLIRLRTLAIELGVTRQALDYRAKAGDFETTPWGKYPCVTKEEAEKVRRLFANPRRSTYEGWLTSEQVAQAIGTTQGRLHKLVTGQQPADWQGIRFVRTQGKSGWAYLFNPADLPEINRRFGRRAVPKRYAGHYTAPQLADLLGIPETRVLTWGRKGAPRRLDWYRRLWFNPADVRAWLSAGIIRPRDLATLLARLDALCPQQEAA